MKPLKQILESSNDLFKEMAWSHFATIIMFGMLEVALKVREFRLTFDAPIRRGKGKKISTFLNKHLSDAEKNSIVRRYKVDLYGEKRMENATFEKVVMHMWEEVRGGFAHSVGIKWSGMEFGGFKQVNNQDGIPVITLWDDVPMSEWLIVTWQAILTSFGFKGKLKIIDTSK